MSKQTGIWIDTKEAVVILLENGSESVNRIVSGIDTRERVVGESKQFGRFGDQFLDNEKHKENRQKKQAKDFLNSVTETISESEAVVIFGPAGMKHELEKHMKSDQHLAKRLNGVQTADNMTENQMVAWVRDYYKQ